MRYLESKKGRYQRGAYQPSPYWVPEEQATWRVYDLAGSYLPDGATPEVIAIDPTSEPTEYRIATRFTSTDTNNTMRVQQATVTTFAVASNDTWLLANALPRHTGAWHREIVGPITYVVQPSYAFSSARADSAVQFLDSLATSLKVSPIDSLTYYLTTSLDEAYRIIGLETAKRWGPVGGFAQPTNRLLFSGMPAAGENYRHELTHMVILPLMDARTTYFISEGIPTWFGGTAGKSFGTAADELRSFLSGHPSMSLDSLLSSSYSATHFYTAAAVLVDLVHRHGGTEGVKALFEFGPTQAELRLGVARLLGRDWESIAAAWRRHLMSMSSP